MPVKRSNYCEESKMVRYIALMPYYLEMVLNSYSVLIFIAADRQNAEDGHAPLYGRGWTNACTFSITMLRSRSNIELHQVSFFLW